VFEISEKDADSGVGCMVDFLSPTSELEQEFWKWCAHTFL
jgi:hypothetical protein